MCVFNHFHLYGGACWHSHFLHTYVCATLLRVAALYQVTNVVAVERHLGDLRI